MKEVFDSEKGKITVRAMNVTDVEAHMDYLYDNSPSFLESMGFDISLFPGREKHSQRMIETIKKQESLPLHERRYSRVVAELNNQAIAIVLLKPDNDSKTAHAHFHIWDSALRGKGLGMMILKTGLKLLFKHQKRTIAYIEPHKDNKQMNRLMEKCNFEFIGESLFSDLVTRKFVSLKYKIEPHHLGL